MKLVKSHRWDPLGAGLTAAGALVAVWLLLDVAALGTQVRVFWLTQPVLDVTIMVLSRGLRRRPELPDAERRLWRIYGSTAAVMLAGDAGQAAYVWLQPDAAGIFPSVVQALAMFASAAVMVGALLLYPTGALSREARLRTWLDAGAVAVGTGVLMWLLALPSTARIGVTQLFGVTVLILAGFAAARLTLSRALHIRRRAGALMAIGAATQGVFTGQIAADARTLHVALAGQLLGAILICAGYRVHARDRATRVPSGAGGGRRGYSVLPYTVLFAMFVIFAAVAPPGLGTRTWIVVGGLFLVACLVFGRQLLAFRENASLVSRLDASLAELGLQEDRLRSLQLYASDITTIVDAQGNIAYITPAVERVLGKRPDDVLGKAVVAHLHPEDRELLLPKIALLAATPNGTLTYTARFQHSDGSSRWLEVLSRNLREVPGIGGVLSNARDVTEARELQERLRHQATHDPLTGLANRALFDQRLDAAERPALLLIDLDGFKDVNDSYGHHVGDAVLAGVADRLRACLPPGGTAARIGGDEFAVLLPGADREEAQAIADRFGRQLEDPFLIDGRPLRARASVGVAAGDQVLLQDADAAMYRAKRAGRVF
jgi:diguanylate cyclase (GGDEF)-like protein/PAS domain S-box-containing protein